MRTEPTIVLALTTALLVACAPVGTSGNTAGAGIGALPPDERGVVTGTLRLYGGPGKPDGTMALNGTPEAYADVMIVSMGGAQTRTTTDGAGRFSFRLPSGTYRLACSEPRGEIVVWPGTTIRTDCDLSIP